MVFQQIYFGSIPKIPFPRYRNTPFPLTNSSYHPHPVRNMLVHTPLQAVRWVKVEIPTKVSEKWPFPAFWAEKIPEFWYEIPAIENAVRILSRSIEWP